MPESPRRVDLRLTIPTSASYLPLAAELTAKFAEYSGVTAPDAARFARTVATLTADIGAGAANGSIDLLIAVGSGELVVTATSGSRTDRATWPLPD